MCVWMSGPGCYGRNDAGDCAMDAAVLSKAVGKPVRVQCMRYEGTGWDPKAPASIHKSRAAIDKDGNVIAWHFESKAFSRLEFFRNEAAPRHARRATLGWPLKPVWFFGMPAESYAFANKQGLGDDRAAARSRIAAAHLAPARSGRDADPFRRRILHGRAGARDQPIRSNSGCAT